MDIFKDEITPEIVRIQNSLTAKVELTEEDLKLILLNILREEDINELK